MTIDPTQIQLSLTHFADSQLEQLGVVIPHDAKRRALVDAAFDNAIEPVESTVERQYLANATVAGKRVTLLCLEVQGSRYRDAATTLIVRGAFTPERAAELSAVGKGLAPYSNEIRSHHVGRKQEHANNDSADR